MQLVALRRALAGTVTIPAAEVIRASTTHAVIGTGECVNEGWSGGVERLRSSAPSPYVEPAHRDERSARVQSCGQAHARASGSSALTVRTGERSSRATVEGAERRGSSPQLPYVEPKPIGAQPCQHQHKRGHRRRGFTTH